MAPANGNDDPSSPNDDLAQELERLMRELEGESSEEGGSQPPDDQVSFAEPAIDDLSITLQHLIAEIDDLRAEIIEQTNHRMRRLIRINHVETLRQLLRSEQRARDDLRAVESHLLAELRVIHELILASLASGSDANEGHNDAGEITSLP